MNYSQSLQYLSRLGNEVLTMKFGLRNIETLLARLEDPQRTFPALIIAGTNGKGSVAAMIESVLRAAGYRTGLYTSPHLIEVRERFRVSGVPITEDDFALHFSRVVAAIESLLQAGTLPTHPTFFETITAVAFDYFRARKIDAAVLEVGMGGRLDSTNVVIPEVSVITTISYDHVQYLGDTLHQIACEKAGVLKPGVPAVTGWMKTKISRFFTEECRRLGCPLHRAPDECAYRILDRACGRYRFEVKTRRQNYAPIELPLLGKHQVRNALLALLTCEILGDRGWSLGAQAVVAGLQQCQWEGRLEKLALPKRCLFVDGAHNEEAIRQLVLFIRTHLGGRVDLIFGMLKDKDIQMAAGLLAPFADTVYLPRLQSERATTPEKIRPYFPNNCVEAESVACALALACCSQSDLPLLACGSLYLVGEIKQVIQFSH